MPAISLDTERDTLNMGRFQHQKYKITIFELSELCTPLKSETGARMIEKIC